MAREKKAKTDIQTKTVSVDMAKLTEGIHLVFSGAVKMLEAMAYTVPVDSSFTANSITDDSSAIDSVSAENRIDSDKPKADAIVDKPPREQHQELPHEQPPETKAETKAKTKAEQKKTPQEEQKNEPQESKEKAEKAAVSVTPNDITRIIVRKIKQNKENNEKILMILKTYGVEKVSDLKPEKYEAFVTDLAAL